MRAWPALIVSPLIALASIGLGYALVNPVCTKGLTWALHALILGSLAVSLATTALAWTERREFLGLMALWCGAFFSLVIAVQWLAQFFVTPCMS